MLKEVFVPSEDKNAILPARIDVKNKQDEVVLSLITSTAADPFFNLVIMETEEDPRITELFDNYVLALKSFQYIKAAIENQIKASERFKQSSEAFINDRNSLLEAKVLLAGIKAGIK